MTYFDKLLELKGGDAKEAARATYTRCPKEFFEGAPSSCRDNGGDIGLGACCKCWFSEVEEKE